MLQLGQVIPRYRERMLVRPGLTGLAQVQLPPDTDLPSVQRKLAYDIYYLEHMSLGLDWRLLIATAGHVLHIPSGWYVKYLALPGGKKVEEAYAKTIGGREDRGLLPSFQPA